ncbi:hypothetical protein [Clostridiisalibacter paucivorans]|uniref:hypothetical protein n=1 Tax=Clostridiisalibacter paucivorans TaxID=408753 RepID=UPI00047B1A5C|nr:hypothetical protein [Clostridiisalibacter paucivorans]
MVKISKAKNSNKIFVLTLVILLILMTFMPNFTQAAVGDTGNPMDTGLINLYFGDPDYSPVPPESLMVFEETGTNEYDAVYIGSNANIYYPNQLLLVIRPNSGSGSVAITNMVATDVSLSQPSGTTGVYDVKLDDVTQPKIEFDATVGSEAQSITITFHQPKEDTSAGSGIYAFLPAPGQFTNEGIDTGGWGTVYNSGATTYKNMVEHMATTGVSLGYFGGYIVFDMDRIDNDPNHPGGYDFEVIGNAFSGNSEPGGIQVSQDGDTWYDIAGSFHYDDDIDWNYEVTYVDPFDKGSNESDKAPIPYYIKGNTSNTDQVATNAYHNHNWFPLSDNYITGLDKATGPNKLTFAEHKSGQDALGYTNTNTLTLSGVLLGGIQNGSTAAGAFGYADVTPGGDKIDLDWAVDSNGEPVDLSWIRYVRVYNAVAKDVPPFGEISPEVKGIHSITDTSGSGSTTAKPTVTVGGVTANLSNDSKQVVHIATGIQPLRDVVVTSTASNIWINGQKVNSGDPVSINVAPVGTTLVRVIVQDDTDEPYIALLKVTR